jgi:mannose-6-phosphate isomerase-like protein (cupin superfamily)
MNFHLTLEQAREALARESNPFVMLMKDKAMRIEYFSPKGIDTQAPHSQDELYVITSGTSDFIRASEMVRCKMGDVLFVPSGMVHRFQNFSNDFATWVIFY